MKTVNILLAGVGGQGILLAGEILSLSLIEMGFDVKKSEVHGMAQRGGSVISHVRFGQRVDSPIIPKGKADILLAFEALEALRYINYLNPAGPLIVNRQEIMPLSVTSGSMKYPEDIYFKIEQRHRRTHFVDALRLADKTGSVRTVNSVMLGVLSLSLGIPSEIIKKVMARLLPSEKLVFMNLRAFEFGRQNLTARQVEEDIWRHNAIDLVIADKSKANINAQREKRSYESANFH